MNRSPSTTAAEHERNVKAVYAALTNDERAVVHIHKRAFNTTIGKPLTQRILLELAEQGKAVRVFGFWRRTTPQEEHDREGPTAPPVGLGLAGLAPSEDKACLAVLGALAVANAPTTANTLAKSTRLPIIKTRDALRHLRDAAMVEGAGKDTSGNGRPSRLWDTTPLGRNTLSALAANAAMAASDSDSETGEDPEWAALQTRAEALTTRMDRMHELMRSARDELTSIRVTLARYRASQ